MFVEVAVDKMALGWAVEKQAVMEQGTAVDNVEVFGCRFEQ